MAAAAEQPLGSQWDPLTLGSSNTSVPWLPAGSVSCKLLCMKQRGVGWHLTRVNTGSVCHTHRGLVLLQLSSAASNSLWCSIHLNLNDPLPPRKLCKSQAPSPEPAPPPPPPAHFLACWFCRPATLKGLFMLCDGSGVDEWCWVTASTATLFNSSHESLQTRPMQPSRTRHV